MTFTVDRLRPDDWERARSLRLAALREAPDAFYTEMVRELDVGQSGPMP